MKILLISQFAKSSTDPYFYADSFARIWMQKHEVNKVNCRAWRFFPQWLFNLLLNLQALWQFYWFAPDVVFLLKAENLNYRVLRFFREFKVKLFNFYPDSPFLFANGNSNANALLSLPFYDKFLIWDKALIPALQSAGARCVEFFNFYPDLELWQTQPQPEKKYDVSFIGTWDAKREKLLTHLIQALPDTNLLVAGNLWQKKLSSRSPLHKHLLPTSLPVKKIAQIFATSKICLNILRPQNAGACNMRTFEIPVAGGFLLSELSLGQVKVFSPGQEAAYFKNADELVEQVQKYLSSAAEREKTCSAGAEKVKVLGSQDQVNWFE